MDRTLEYTIMPEDAGKKLLSFLRGRLGMSARSVTRLRHSPGSLLCNGEPIRTVDPVKAGDVITVKIREPAGAVTAQSGKPDIVFEDDDILVVNKPAGLAVHPTHNHQGDTLANLTAGYLERKGKSGAFRAVGRLDKQTSGLVLCALHRHAASLLSGRYEKIYYAVAEGSFSGEGEIERPIYRPDPQKTLRAVGDGGDYALTKWRALDSGNGLTLLEVRPVTGRTHQIRVHFASLGAPLAGDEMYGGSTERIKRAALHCAFLSLRHPITDEEMTFSAPLPQDMEALLEAIRGSL